MNAYQIQQLNAQLRDIIEFRYRDEYEEPGVNPWLVGGATASGIGALGAGGVYLRGRHTLGEAAKDAKGWEGFKKTMGAGWDALGGDIRQGAGKANKLGRKYIPGYGFVIDKTAAGYELARQKAEKAANVAKFIGKGIAGHAEDFLDVGNTKHADFWAKRNPAAAPIATAKVAKIGIRKWLR